MIEPPSLPTLDPAEAFRQGTHPLNFSVGEFWQWAFSDLRSNTTRGVLAEFIVARALGLPTSVRNAWDNYDLLALDQTKVEVKATGRAQSWDQKKSSPPLFTGLKARKWLDDTSYSPDQQFRADAYVFCLHTAEPGAPYDPLDLSLWKFRVLGRSELVKLNQKSLGLSTLHRLAPTNVPWEQLKQRVSETGSRERERSGA